jgi:1,5-anhydro-D-fructose reductase (1,5-anhydro-D-mannitol-forming)
MTKQLTVAVVGFWHVHAPDYAKLAEAASGTRLVAVWDDDHERGRAGAAEFGVDFVDDLDALLARDDLDAVIVTTATNQHTEIIAKVARAGKHIYTEKLLAPTVAESEELVRVAGEHGIALVVSLPRLSSGSTVAVQRVLDAGKLGQLTYSRVHVSHDGWVKGWLPDRFGNAEEAIGGSFTDLGVHAAYLTQLFLGARPSTISATYTRVSGHAVEDNAVVTVTYPDGAIGVMESSNVATPGEFTLELHGTEGSLHFGFGSETMLVRGDHFDTEEWTELKVPDALPHPFDQWIDHINEGTRADANLRAAVELTRFIVAANESAAQGKTAEYK